MREREGVGGQSYGKRWRGKLAVEREREREQEPDTAQMWSP